MILSDHSIGIQLLEGRIGISPSPRGAAIQPASLELHLDWEWAAIGRGTGPVLPASLLTLAPGAFLLAHTVETVTLPHDIAAQLSGKSSLGRLGLLVHATAGWIDPGFSGQIVLELKNLGSETILLELGQPVAQLVFHQLDRPALTPYGHPGLGSHYQGQRGTVRSHLAAHTNAPATESDNPV